MNVCASPCSQEKEVGHIHVIPSTTEKYITFWWRQFNFIDSLAFMNASLDKLSSITPDDEFHHLMKEYPDPQRLTLMRRKGVYPYEYMDKFDRFEETRLPSQEAFFSTLTKSVGIFFLKKNLTVSVYVYMYVLVCEFVSRLSLVSIHARVYRHKVYTGVCVGFFFSNRALQMQTMHMLRKFGRRLDAQILEIITIITSKQVSIWGGRGEGGIINVCVCV